MEKVSIQKLESAVFLSTLSEMHLLHLTIKINYARKKGSLCSTSSQRFFHENIHPHNQERHGMKSHCYKGFLLRISDECKFEFDTVRYAECIKHKLRQGRFQIGAPMKYLRNKTSQIMLHYKHPTCVVEYVFI